VIFRWGMALVEKKKDEYLKTLKEVLKKIGK
jgi:hypothetical protein